MPLSEKEFEKLLKEKIKYDLFWILSLEIFREYGEAFSMDIYNILEYVLGHCPANLGPVLWALKDHLEHNKRFPEELRGDHTKTMLLQICSDLGCKFAKNPDIDQKGEQCGWYGGKYGPPADGHWHCYCLMPSGSCKALMDGGSGVHLSPGESCPHGEMCGFK